MRSEQVSCLCLNLPPAVPIASFEDGEDWRAAQAGCTDEVGRELLSVVRYR